MDFPHSSKYVDFGLSASIFHEHRPELPAEYYERLARLGIGLPGQRIVDLGCGTGLVSYALARRGCQVTGVDISNALLDEAKALPDYAQCGGAVQFVNAPAEETGLPAASFDALTAATCWHYFDQERAMSEARRILIPGARMAVSWFYWLPLPGSIAERTETLVQRHNPAWRYAGVLGISGESVRRFTLELSEVESMSFDTPLSFSHAGWRMRMRSCGGVGSALSAEEIEAFDAELADLLKGEPAELSVLHRSFIVSGRV